MKESSYFKLIFTQLFVRLFTALSFLLFTAYQVYLAVNIEENRVGRLIGVSLYALITLASFFAFSEKRAFRVTRSILLVFSLMSLFVIRLFNLPALFRSLQNANATAALNFLIYFCSQLGTVVLLVGYLIHKSKMEEKPKRITTIVMMSIVIGLYVACLSMESILMIVYRFNIDLSLKFTLVSRLLYCFGFVGTAVGIMMPAPKIKQEHKPGRYIYSDDDEEEIDLVI